MKFLNLFIFLFILCKLNLIKCKENFKLLSRTSFPIDKCTPHAYADFNADKLIDIFCVSETGRA
jgi:hypothetical protein